MQGPKLPPAEAEKLAGTKRYWRRQRKAKAKRRNLGRRIAKQQPGDELSFKELERLGLDVDWQQRNRLVGRFGDDCYDDDHSDWSLIWDYSRN